MAQAQYNLAPNPVANNTQADWDNLVKSGIATSTRRIFAKHLKPDGTVDQAGFYKDAADAGLDPVSAATGLQWQMRQSDDALKQVQNNATLASYGGDYTAGGRANAQYGEPKPVQPYDMTKDTDIPAEPRHPMVAPTPKAAESAEPKQTSTWDKFVGMFKPAPEPAAQAPLTPEEQQQVALQNQIVRTEPGAEQQPQQNTTDAGMLGTSKITASTEDPFAQPQPQPGPDNRTYTQKIEDSVNYNQFRPDAGVAVTPEAAAAAKKQRDELFQWAPTNDGSQQFQQYDSALKSKLNASGFKDASGYLQHIYDATYAANMPPKPNRALRMQGREGQIKYQGEQAAYEAGLQKADGAAQAAVLKERATLADFAKQFGVNTVEQNKSELPGGLMLRDHAKRNEAAALITNQDNIAYAKKAVAEAGTDTTKLSLAYPIVARAYATALNPGQQLSEGNLSEVASALYPDQHLDKQFMTKALLAVGRWFKSGFSDTSGLDQLNNAIEASNPGAISGRIASMAAEAERLNDKTLASYTYRNAPPAAAVPEAAQEQGSPRVDVGPRPPSPSSWDANGPEEDVDKRAALAQYLGMNGYRALTGQQPQPLEAPAPANRPAPRSAAPAQPNRPAKPAVRTSKRGPV